MPDAATLAGGTAVASCPNVCTKPNPAPAPPAPAPFPSSAMLAQGMRPTASQKAKEKNMPLYLKDSVIPMSTGDEAGSLFGVVSGTIKALVKVLRGSTKAKSGGRPIAMQGSDTSHNGPSANAPVGKIVQVAPSKLKLNM